MEADDIAPQPCFAGVNRALDALANLGSPVPAEDAQQLAVLSRQNDSAAVDAAEEILGRYTLVNLSTNSDGSVQVTSGRAPTTLIEQGWRMFLVRVSNPAGRMADMSVSIGTERTWGPVPGQMMPSGNGLAQRTFLMDSLNKGLPIEAMWLLAQL